MMEKLLSVIVPVYNVEGYIGECINSILEQSYRNLEIIIINDGSTDASLEICKSFALKDNRIRLISQENQGVVTTRRFGAELANGQYIAFVDGDDYLEPEMYSYMMRYMENVDLVVSGYFHHFSEVRIEKRYDDFEGAYTTKEQMQYVWKRMVYNMDEAEISDLTPSLWSKIFKTDLVRKIMEQMNPDIFYGEDAVFLYQYLLECKSVYFFKNALYHYRFRADSVCRSKNEKMLENINCVYCELKKVFEQHSMKDVLMAQLQKRTIYNTIDALNRYMGFSSAYRIPRFTICIENLKGQKLVLYGASYMGQDIMYELLNENIKPVAWVDKNYKYLQDQGLEVDSPNIIQTIEFDLIVIVVSKEGLANEIKKELLAMGVSEDSIMWKKPMKIY